MRRAKGSGSIYHRTADDLWVAVLNIPKDLSQPRKRRVKYGKTQQEAADKLAAMFEEHGLTPRVRPEGTAEHIRALRMEAARKLGTHTPREWYALLRARNNRCHYCDVRGWHGNKLCKDHRVPVSRGGSDAIDNIAPACRRCNTEKFNLTDEEFLADASREERRERREEAEAKRRRLRLQARERREMGGDSGPRVA